MDIWGATMTERADVIETVQGAGYRFNPPPSGAQSALLETPTESETSRAHEPPGRPQEDA